MAKYKVKSMYFPNGNNIHKGGEVIDETEIIGGESKLKEHLKNGFLVPHDKIKENK